MWSFILFIMSFLFLMVGFYSLIYNTSFLVELLIFSFNSLSVNYILYIDWISMLFSFVVFFISSMVVLYSSEYMGSYNYSSIRFLMLVLMFVFSMLLMIISPNMVSIMLGWDGLGLVSYCLVIYYNSLSSYLAGMMTCLINRLGDIGLLLSIGWISSYGSWTFMFYIDYINYSIFYLIIFSCFTSSAQIPFSSWLPAAMAAPTPVSSLVHSSTLVTAGVYLIIRFYNFTFMLNSFFLFISLMTMIMSSIGAIYEYDLSKIIALSTLSQLGLMMSSLFMGLVDLSFFHLLSHAMFKSLLFLCSGIIIHFMGSCQDIRMMGSICFVMPLTCCCFNISNMALCGFPFLSGFYSKDLIVESSLFQGMNFFIMILFYLSLSLTSLYSMRLFYYMVLTNNSFICFSMLSEDMYLMKYSVYFLCMFSIVFGCLFIWLLNLDMCFLLMPFYLKIFTLIMVIFGSYIGYELNNFNYLMPIKYYLLSGSMWFMYSYSYNLYYLNYFYTYNLLLSLNWGEYYGGLGLSYYLMKLSNFLQFYSMGSLKIFFLTMMVWFIMMI